MKLSVEFTLLKELPTDAGENRRFVCRCVCGKVIKGNLSNLKRDLGCGCRMPLAAANARKHWHGKPDGVAALNSLFAQYRYKAKRRCLEWNLSKTDFERLTKGNCAYCGKPPRMCVRNPNGNGDYVYNGVDRIDNKAGYAVENTVSCCDTCNKAKLQQTPAQFKLWIIDVYNHYVIGVSGGGTSTEDVSTETC